MEIVETTIIDVVEFCAYGIKPSALLNSVACLTHDNFPEKQMDLELYQQAVDNCSDKIDLVLKPFIDYRQDDLVYKYVYVPKGSHNLMD